MSVPGLFTPMEVDGRIFGDGGLVDNLPVDIVRQMGADVIIAVNIGTPLMNAEQLQSIVGLTAQSLNILTQQNVRASIALLRQGPHVLISPDLGKLTFADFSSGPRLIELGEAAARVQADALAKYALPQDAWREFVASRTVLPPVGDPIVASVSFEGAVRANPAVLLEQVDSVAGKPFDAATVDADVARLYGSGDYERVSYRLIDEKGAARPRVRRHREDVGTELPALRPQPVLRSAGRELFQRPDRPQADVDQQPRRPVDQRDHVRADAPLRDRVLPAAREVADVFRLRCTARSCASRAISTMATCASPSTTS